MLDVHTACLQMYAGYMAVSELMCRMLSVHLHWSPTNNTCTLFRHIHRFAWEPDVTYEHDRFNCMAWHTYVAVWSLGSVCTWCTPFNILFAKQSISLAFCL